MSANPAFGYPNVTVGKRVRITKGYQSDHPNYFDETGTVKQTFPSGTVEVDLDNHSWTAIFAAEHLEVMP
jgi:hypothetical protein